MWLILYPGQHFSPSPSCSNLRFRRGFVRTYTTEPWSNSPPQPKVWGGEKAKAKGGWDAGVDLESCQVAKDPGTGLFDKGLGCVQCLAEAIIIL